MRWGVSRFTGVGAGAAETGVGMNDANSRASDTKEGRGFAVLIVMLVVWVLLYFREMRRETEKRKRDES